MISRYSCVESRVLPGSSRVVILIVVTLVSYCSERGTERRWRVVRSADKKPLIAQQPACYHGYQNTLKMPETLYLYITLHNFYNTMNTSNTEYF